MMLEGKGGISNSFIVGEFLVSTIYHFHNFTHGGEGKGR